MKQQAKGLDEIFQLEAEEENLPDISEPCTELMLSDEEDQPDDSKFIRDELKALIELSKKALATATGAQSEEAIARNSEAVAGLIGSIDKALNTLINLNKSDIGPKSKKEEIGIPNISESNVIITTTEDIIAKITNNLKKEES